MDKSRVLDVLGSRRQEFARRFGVKRIALFGSTARGEAGSGSDVDILVAFERPATFDDYFGLKFLLEDLLGVDVDLVVEDSVRNAIRPHIDRDAVYVP
jgi:predicted nucleotidyltransferase